MTTIMMTFASKLCDNKKNYFRISTQKNKELMNDIILNSKLKNGELTNIC